MFFLFFVFSSKLTLTTQDSRKTFSKLPETTFRNPGFDYQILCGGLMATAQLFRFTLNTIGWETCIFQDKKQCCALAEGTARGGTPKPSEKYFSQCQQASFMPRTSTTWKDCDKNCRSCFSPSNFSKACWGHEPSKTETFSFRPSSQWLAQGSGAKGPPKKNSTKMKGKPPTPHPGTAELLDPRESLRGP